MRHTIEYHDRLKFGFWLVFDKSGSVRLTRTMPKLARTERSMSISAELPKSLFETPSLKATLTFNDEVSAREIDIDVASEALKSVLGVDIDVQVIDGTPSS